MSADVKTFFLTGGTGFLGSHIAVELMKRGHRVIMAARPRQGLSPQSRIRALMEWFGFDPGRQLDVLEAYLERPGLGLKPDRQRWLNSEVNEVFHCAADTRFSRRLQNVGEQVNLQGLIRVFECFNDCRHFHYMSTAYVAGKSSGRCLEKLENTRSFHNQYEESKYRAEQAIHRLCREQGVKLTVYRPSVVYGNSVSGRSFRFNALYYPVRVLWNLRRAFARDIRNKKGQRARGMGVRLLPDDFIEMPLRLIDHGGGVDLIPVDFMCRSVMAIMESGSEGIFHINNPRLSTVTELVGYIQQFCRITGIQTIRQTGNSGFHALEKLVDEMFELYRPYFCDLRIFDHARTQPLLDAAGLACPELDYGIFARCMDYAVETGWGRRLSL